MSQQHTLIITREGDRWSCRVECPGVSDACRAWYECIPCNALDWDGDEYEALSETGEAHGEEHRRIDNFGWGTSSNDCLVQVHAYLWDAVLNALPLDDGRQPQPGVYPIGFQFDGESIELTVLAEAGAR